MPAAARVPASIRNRNPGAMYPGAASKKFGSTSHQVLKSKDGTHLIATFPTDVQGAAAMFHLLASSSYADGKRTVREAITKWCGGFYVSTYLQVLEGQAGVSRDAVLTRALVCNPDVAIPLAQAMAWQEAGREYPLGDEGWRQAHALALPQAVTEAAVAGAQAGNGAGAAAALPGPADAEGWDRSQRSKPEERIKDAASSSWTIRGAGLGLVAWFGKVIEESFGAVHGALSGAQQLLGPGTPGASLAAAAKVSTNELFLCVGIGALLIVVARRYSDAEEGNTK